MDKKLQDYAARSAKNKRRMESNLRDNHGQQPPFKRQNVSGHNVARAYAAGNNEKRGYAGPHPLCNKYRYHNVRPCTVNCNNCKRVGHQTRDYRSAAAIPNTQRVPLGNQQGVICYKCGRSGHVKRECPKLRNQNHGDRVGNKTGDQTGGNEATATAYAIGGGGTNPDSNIVKGTFLLNCYASMLFDWGADRSFVSSTFSTLLDIAPSTLDTSYAVKLVNGRISETNVVLRRCMHVTPPDTIPYRARFGVYRLVSRAKSIEKQVMAISVFQFLRTHLRVRVGHLQDEFTIQTPIIAPTIPPSSDYTPASPDYSPASDSESNPSEDPSLDHIPPLPAISPFLSSADDTTDSDTPDTTPSPTYAPGQPIPHGRSYRYHLNGPVHMMTARKRVGLLPTHRLAVRHSVDHSSSDSSSEASSDFHSDASSDSSLRHSLPDHSSPDLPSTSAGPSRKRRRSPMTSVPVLPLVSGALSLVHANLIPSPQRIRSPEAATDLEGCSKDSFKPYVPREVGLGVDVEDESSEPSRSKGADLEMDVDGAEIEECFAYANALRDRGIDARVVVETVARYDVETGTRDLIVVSDDGDTPPVVPKVIEGVQREQGHRIIGVESAVTALTKRIAELERDNWRLRDTASVESQRDDRLQRGISCMQRELRQI
ncbi:putative reverse transcriptase domain-containing protein [Tanacetum coccineum]